MKRLLRAFSVVTLVVISSGLLLAQSDPFIGVWKLNLAKSKFGTATPPKSMTRTAVAQGDAVKTSIEGVNADGSQFNFAWTGRYDGKDSPVSGAGQFNAADSIATKRIDSNTATSVNKKASKVVAEASGVVSKDGKVLTIDTKGTDVNGKPRHVVAVYDRQ